ncbi:MAG: hypothetical protein H5T97_14330, partial [Firmicutes bacterium]|nr:hypothetical protein [Bacillota bacterium]
FKTDRIPYQVRDKEQLSLYGWMLHRALGVKEVPSRLVFLREPRQSRFVEEVLTVRDFARARDWALAAVESIYAAEADLLSGLPEKLAFPPKPGRSCKFCYHVGACLGIEMPEPECPDDAASLAGTVLVLERALEAAREKLRPYVEANGPVSVGGEVFLVKESSRLEVPPENLREIARIIEAAGGDPFRYLSFSGAALSRALRKHPGIKEDVAALVEEKPSFSLRHEVEKKAG